METEMSPGELKKRLEWINEELFVIGMADSLTWEEHAKRSQLQAEKTKITDDLNQLEGRQKTMTEKAVAIRENTHILNFEDYAMPVASLVRQVGLIQEVMQKVMKEGEHYGRIPGTDRNCPECDGRGNLKGSTCKKCDGSGKVSKPSLLKSGAEKLNLTFRFHPDYEIIREVRERDFIAYTVKCVLTHIPTGQRIASGIGSCNSREAKYRYRFNEALTEDPVPKEYWKAREAGDSKEMKRLLGEGMRARKNEATGTWVIAKAEKVENDNPWDLDNTIIKMSCKRSLVAAVLNGTAASDIFTQDLEDQEPPINEDPYGHETETSRSGTQGTHKKGSGKKAPPSGGGPVKAVKCPETGKFRPETDCQECIVANCKARPENAIPVEKAEDPEKDTTTKGEAKKSKEEASGDSGGLFECPDTKKMIVKGKCADCIHRGVCSAGR